MLVPILVIGQDIEEVNELIHRSDGEGLEEAEKILSKGAFEKKNFKKIFNAFGTFVVVNLQPEHKKIKRLDHTTQNHRLRISAHHRDGAGRKMGRRADTL